MPAKNRVKLYVENGYYHLYNRGVAKNNIFLSSLDYGVFLSYLKEYLSPFIPPTEEEIADQGRVYFRKNYYSKIKLMAFVLMPNHFHFLLKQSEIRAIEGFMRSLITRYCGYFNRHYKRVGHLFQDNYKGILIGQENYFLWLSRYIHLNPQELLEKTDSLISYPYSSYPTYLGKSKTDWLNIGDVTSQIKNYQEFVEGLPEGEPDGLGYFSLD